MEVKFNHVFYVYNEKTPLSKMVLGDINTTFKEGKITGIMGKSGSGKTTLIELINALIIPTKGNIQVGSRVISKTRKIKNINNLRYKIGLVFQVPEEQFFCKTVKEEIEFGMKYFKKSVKSIEKHVSDALIMMGLDDSYLNRNPFTLSSGEMRKVAIASVLAFNPKIIILDEPTIGLDNKSKENLIKIIKLLKNRYKKTIIVVSNDTDLLLKISDNVILLDKGKIILEGNKYDVFKQDISKYGLKRPKIIEFEQLVLEKKGIKIGYRDDINDLMKDVYRYVK
ncbi:MAG TPA: ATP-binding cassette domain-containing protein [Candidatus Faecisoma merdavium]|nr:ATP-binding cassette domain-containing protein [Candidatus Faecisoma merdavium]